MTNQERLEYNEELLGELKLDISKANKLDTLQRLALDILNTVEQVRETRELI